jgi:hypothetical protein
LLGAQEAPLGGKMGTEKKEEYSRHMTVLFLASMSIVTWSSILQSSDLRDIV